MARQRTQKTVSARIDRGYIDRNQPLRKIRRQLVFFCTVAAILFVAIVTIGGKGELVHNPGRLTFVHASFQNDCAKCHDGCDAQGRPTSKFSKAVSDAACLKCHDAGIHNANQAISQGVILDNTRHPPQLRSADCTSCHVEHRGQAALVSTSDELCVNCHSDLTGKTANPPPAEVPMHVTAFTLDGHPHFGRSLMVKGQPVDPTNLRFNHKKHIMGDPAKGISPAIDAKHADMRNCTFCHDPSPAAAESLTWETGKSAFQSPSDKPLVSPQPLLDGTGRHRSMAQVNYNEDCKVCHDLGSLPNADNIAIPHASMGEVRKVILAYITDAQAPWQKYAKDSTGAKEKPLNDRIISKLTLPDNPDASAAMDAVTKAVKTAPLSAEVNLGDLQAKLPPDVVEKLVAAAVKLPTNIVPAADRAKVGNAVSATTQPADHLRPLVIARLREEAVKGLSGAAKQKMYDQFDAAFARFNQDTPDPRLLQIYVAYANDAGTSCVKCHDMQGDASGVPTEWASLSSPVKPAADAPVFQTKPTEIPAGPRRWYVNSEFNHDAHRSMNCLECHSAALTSEKTSDVLSPDIQWQGMAFNPDGQLVSATRSCVECHHADNSEGLGAASNCTECHIFHDRSHETLTKPTPPDVMNAKPPAKSQVSAAAP